MPLLDHFRPPLYGERHSESFHAQWAGALAAGLNVGLLPPGYFAEVQVHVGPRVEVDVATWESLSRASAPAPSSDGGTATLTAPAWAPPVPQLAMPAIFPDDLEVLVYSSEAGPTLVAVVELVSPGNKDRAEYRRAFAAKCASYLHRGIGLVMVDVVTTRQANLHDEMVRLMGLSEDAFAFPGGNPLYTAAYRPVRRAQTDQIDVWTAPLVVGNPLPIMPLPVLGYGCIRLDLESSYTEARQRSRLA
jgi:hypothetical protein